MPAAFKLTHYLAVRRTPASKRSHQLGILQPTNRARRQHRRLNRLSIGRANVIEHERPMMSCVAILAEHDDILRRFEAAARVRLVMDFESRCGRAQRALMARTIEGEGFDPEPVRRAQ